MNYRFSKLSNYLGDYKSYIPQLDSVNKYNENTFQPISLFECKKQIKNLNINKPIGTSKIPTWALKDAMNVTAEPLTFLIKAFPEKGIFPNHLKQAFDIPIFKKGDCEEPNNYRPIPITPALSKIFEKVLRDQITQYLNRKKLLTSSPFGFLENFFLC